MVWDVARPFIQPVTVTGEHLDGFGHVNNVNYLKWLEDVAWAHSNALGLGWEAYRRLNAGCVVYRHELDYVAATFAGDELLSATWIHENSGRLDMWRRYQIIRIADGKTVMRAASHFICVDFTTGRPKRQPAEFVAAYTTGRGALD
ncbi:MAG: thioesterase family protein [Pseudomonadota bacterium]